MKNARCRCMVPSLCILVFLVLMTPAAAADAYYPPCPASEASLVDGLKAVDGDASFDSRAAIAAANGITDYKGSAAQNLRLLKLLKEGKLLRKPAAPLMGNAESAAFLSQDHKTCKATAVAMAINILRGADENTTADLGGNCCRSIEGETFTGADGNIYAGQYRTDGYLGSEEELLAVMDAAIKTGLPAVIPVHSTRSRGTKHHWVLLLGRDGEDYRIADPACRWRGSIAACASTLSQRNYALGLADDDTLHFGWVTFVPQ